MDFLRSQEEAAFREEVRGFLRAHLPPALAARGLAGHFSAAAETLPWQKILNGQGWGAPTWPVEFGGTGWTPLQVMLFEEEARIAGAPTQNIQGFELLGPVVMEYGTEHQKAAILPPLMRGETLWCQGFSEPGSGSDLASLRTAARIEDDRIVINGSKIWTTSAHEATHIFLLVRTSTGARKHEGISFVVAPMDTPGITVRPIYSIDGDHHLNETFLDDVCLPASAMVGPPGAGWEIARFLLNNERITGLPFLKATVSRLHRLCHALDARGALSLDAKREADAISLELEAIDMLARKLILMPRNRDIGTSVSSSTYKILQANLHQRTTRAMVRTAGRAAIVDYEDPRTAIAISGEYLYSRAISIYGGANEIQKNIISRAVLRTYS